MTLGVLKTLMYLTINFPTERSGFVSSTSALGCAMVGLGLQDSASSSAMWRYPGSGQEWGWCLYNGLEIFAVFELAFGDSFEGVHGPLRLQGPQVEQE